MSRIGLFLVSVLLTGLAGCNALPLCKRPVTAQSPETIQKFAMVRLLEHQGQRDKAVAIYEALLAADSDSPHAAGPYHRLAVINVAQNRDEKAETYFREASRLAPGDAEILNDYGYWLSLHGRLAESERVLRAAREADTTDKTVLNNLAVVVGQAGRYGESLALFRAATDTEAAAQSNLAFVLVKAHKYKDARRCYEKALTLEPGLKPAQDALVQLSAAETATPASKLKPTPPADPQILRAGGTSSAASRSK